MFFEIKGGTRAQKAAVIDAAAFCLPNLFTRKMLNNLDVTVEISKIGDAFGYCSWEDDNVRPREFLIQLHREMGRPDLIKSFFHEAVHMKQYVYDELKERYKNGHKIFWYDEDHSKTPYENQPWENEAKEMEKILYSNFINR